MRPRDIPEDATYDEIATEARPLDTSPDLDLDAAWRQLSDLPMTSPETQRLAAAITRSKDV